MIKKTPLEFLWSLNHMDSLVEAFKIALTVSPDRLAGLVALSGIALAGFAIHVIYSVTKNKDR